MATKKESRLDATCKAISIFRSEAGKAAVHAEYEKVLSAWPVPCRRHRVPTAWGETFALEFGSPDRPALLLLHGSLSNSFSWFGDAQTLSERWHVFAVDLIGEAGLSAESRPAYESGAYERWLGEVMDGMGVAQCAITGISLGGWMALRFATVHPERVSALVLLCPGGLAMQRRDFLFRMILRQIASLGSKRKAVDGMLGMKAATPEEEEGMRRAMAFVMLVIKHEKPRMELLPVFTDEELGKLAMPLLVVFGDQDILLDAPRSLERIRRLAPHEETVLLKDTGHAVVGQGERIARFLAEHGIL